MRLAVLAIAALVSGCGPGRTTGAAILVDPAGLTSLEQARVSAVVAASIAHHGVLLRGYTICVEPYPLRFDPPQRTKFGTTITEAVSMVDTEQKVMILTWQRESTGGIDVESADYEIANVACDCESAILPGGHLP